MRLTPELAPVFVRVHTCVKNRRPRGDGEFTHPKTWANFALVFDCETTTDLREDLNFLWWRFCELKDGAYVCQREGVVYQDDLDAKFVTLIHEFAGSKRADVEDGCPEDILVQSRTRFVDGEFWDALRMGAVIVNFNAPFDLSRLGLTFPEAKSKNTGWAMVLWNYRGRPDRLKPKLRIKPKDSRAAFIDVAGGDPANRLIYRGRFLDLSVFGWALRNRHLDLNGFLRSFGLKPKMPHEPTGRVTKRELAYLLLKIIANALYGIFAELNTYHHGKNRAKQLDVFSGERQFDQPAVVVERPGRWHFPPAAALITARTQTSAE